MDNSMTVEKRVQEKLKKAIPQMSDEQKDTLINGATAIILGYECTSDLKKKK